MPDEPTEDNANASEYRFWQLHRGTVIVLVIEAAVLLGMAAKLFGRDVADKDIVVCVVVCAQSGFMTWFVSI